jgi:tocopherol cyclase
MKILNILVFCYAFLLTSAHAEFDQFNTYQWNSEAKKPWYEWWYYKVVLPETNDSFFFVYGIVNPWDQRKSLKGTRAYVGMGDFNANTQVEAKHSIDHFKAAYDQTFVEIGGQTASDQNLKGELKDKDGESYSWDISIQKNWAFNAMGWAIGKDITNISWYPAQASARCSGSILSKGKLYQFTNAPCYQDRNWGSSFPKWWTWIVTNHFKNNPDSALAVGGGLPKYFNRNIPYQGVAIGLKHKGKSYHFRPNDFDKVKIDINFGKWKVLAISALNKIEIEATAPKEKFMDLQFITPTGEVFHDYETLTGEVTVKLYKRSFFKWVLIDTLYSDAAGIEYGEPSTDNKFTKGFDRFFRSVKHLQ